MKRPAVTEWSVDGRNLHLACACGAVQGTVERLDAGCGTHVVCYCADCQSAAAHLGAAAAMDPQGGVAIYQTTPDRIRIAKGAEQLACLRLSNRGMYRWYAACCGTPLAATPAARGFPMAGVLMMAVPDAADRRALGPPVARANVDGARSARGAPPKGAGLGRAAWGILQRGVAALIAGRGRNSPFRDEAGQARGPVRVLSASERRAARAQAAAM